jgi:VWFA-related protein
LTHQCAIRFLAVVVLLGWAGGAIWAQRTAIQTETRLVLVDAIVTGKKGEYVRDLTAKDFQVWEDNKEQTIQSVSFEGTSPGALPSYLVLFFDSAGLEAAGRVLAQQAVSNFIDANAGPNRMMAVLNYNGSTQFAQKFTDDAGRLKDAVKALSSAPVSRDVSSPSDRASRGMTAATNSRARDMLNSASALARNLSTLPGRKILVLVTGYVSPSSDNKSSAEAAIQAASMSGVAIYPIDVRPPSIAAFTNFEPDQGGIARGSRPGRRVSTDDAARDPGAKDQRILFALANGTGGFVIPDSSALLKGLQSVGEEQDEYYVLSYTPPESKEGSCHALRVKVDRPGTSLRARSNYCTAAPPNLLTGTPAERDLGKELESRAAGAQNGALAASMQLPYFYISPSVARVRVAMEIAPDALKFENRQGKPHAEINLLGIASTADGAVGARFSDVVKLDADNPPQVDTLKSKPLHYEKEFRIAPGRYSFTVVFSSGGADFGKLEMPLAVGPWKTGELALSGLVLSKEIHPATDPGPSRDASLIEDQTPLIAQGNRVVPSGTNQFLKSEPVFFYFELYGPNASPVSAAIRILDRQTGEQKWNSGPFKLSSPHQGGDIPVKSLAPGSYQLEVTVGDTADQQVKRTTDFEIR